MTLRVVPEPVGWCWDSDNPTDLRLPHLSGFPKPELDEHLPHNEYLAEFNRRLGQLLRSFFVDK